MQIGATCWGWREALALPASRFASLLASDASQLGALNGELHAAAACTMGYTLLHLYAYAPHDAPHESIETENELVRAGRSSVDWRDGSRVDMGCMFNGSRDRGII